jgi:hypothetical protein
MNRDMSANGTIMNQKQALIYQAEDGSFQIEVRFESETIWLTQRQMAELSAHLIQAYSPLFSGA